MSIYSGKFDLADHIMGMGGWYDKDKNPIEFSTPGVNCYYSDEYRDFLAFKEKTNGVLHQHKQIIVTEMNQTFVANHCSEFKIKTKVEKIPDKRSKNGEREKTTYEYEYYGKTYSNLKELNKKGVFITIDIHFNTLLDLIPYYPYIVTMSCGGTVYISNKPHTIVERDSLYSVGYENGMYDVYTTNLQNHYKNVVLRYFNPEGRIHFEELTFNNKRQATTSKPIDFNFDVKWDTNALHWNEPKVIDFNNGIIEMSEVDYNSHLPHTIKVEYVEAQDYPIYID